MPLHANINGARQRGDAARAAAIGLSLEEGAAAPVAAMGTTNMNLLAAVFGDFTAVPAAGGVGGRGRRRGLQAEHIVAGRGGRGRQGRSGRGGRGRGGRGGGGRSGNYHSQGGRY